MSDVVRESLGIVIGPGIDLDALLTGIGHCSVTRLRRHEDDIVLKVVPGVGDHRQGGVIPHPLGTFRSSSAFARNRKRQDKQTYYKQSNQASNHNVQSRLSFRRLQRNWECYLREPRVNT